MATAISTSASMVAGIMSLNLYQFLLQDINFPKDEKKVYSSFFNGSLGRYRVGVEVQQVPERVYPLIVEINFFELMTMKSLVVALEEQYGIRPFKLTWCDEALNLKDDQPILEYLKTLGFQQKSYTRFVKVSCHTKPPKSAIVLLKGNLQI